MLKLLKDRSSKQHDWRVTAANTVTSIYIAHRRRKTFNARDTLVLSEQECFQ